MNQLVTNASNLEKLRKEFSNAQSEILICSAWITSGTLKRVITKPVQNRIKQGRLKLRVLIRLGEPMDVKITDQGVFQLIEELGEHAELSYHRKLHAKMYVVDNNWAMVGSFNLTGGGFGDEEKPGTNPETGFEFREPNAVMEVIQRFEEIWNDPEVKGIDENLVGFVLSPSTSQEFWMVGIRELQMNLFVQVRVNQDEYLVGKIINSQKHDFNYYESDISTTEFNKRWELMDAFGKSDLGGMAKAMATLPREPQQLKVAQVRITNRVMLENGKLTPGGLTSNTIPPDVANDVFRADKSLLEQIFNVEDFAPATLFSNPDINAGFDPEELTTKHFSVFGSTGSGKSYFVKYLLSHDLYDWFCRRKKGRIIIFDPHNEYTDKKDMPVTFVKDQSKYQSIDGRLYRARLIQDIDDMEEACDLKFSSRDEKSFIDRKLREAIKKSLNDKEFLKFLETESFRKGSHSQLDPKKEFRVLEKAIDASFYQYLDSFETIAKNLVEEGIQSGKINLEDYKDDKGKPSDTVVKSQLVYNKVKELFSGLKPEVKKALKEQVIRKNVYDKVESYFEKDIYLVSRDTLDAIRDAFRNGTVTIEPLDIVNRMQEPKVFQVNLSGIHEEIIRHNLTASICTQIFNVKKDKSSVMDTVFVIEEAHNFAPEGGGRNNPAARIIQKIAAEGRKFNLGLIVITQRPAHVSKGVLSQCSTQAIFRLINQNDLKQIEDVVEGVSEAEVNMLPHFETGQAIFSGVGIKQPVIVKAKRME